jgi:hypothetical protein
MEKAYFNCQGTNIKSQTFGDWHVSINGDMCYKEYYFIDHKRLKQDWILHLLDSKSWDWNDFIPAYFQALTNAGIKELKIKIHY